MKKIYLQMLLWLELPETKFKEAYEVKTQLIDYFIDDDQLAVCNFVLTASNKIDNLFGRHTSEQLLQFVW